jgi:predicted ArsR family transcriptional regulator
MDRKEFFKKACLYGFCSCAGLSLFANSEVFAASETKISGETDWKLEFVQERFSKLIEILKSTVDEKTRNQILESLGRECSMNAAKNYEKYKGDVDGFLKNLQETWAQKATYDKDKKEITIIGKKTDSCFCPFVDINKMSKDFCNCSLGWQKQTFKTILGREVNGQIDSSVLRGGESCNFTIKLA